MGKKTKICSNCKYFSKGICDFLRKLKIKPNEVDPNDLGCEHHVSKNSKLQYKASIW